MRAAALHNTGRQFAFEQQRNARQKNIPLFLAQLAITYMRWSMLDLLSEARLRKFWWE